MSTASRPIDTILRQARLAQTLTLVWMVVETGIGLGAGLAAHSIALSAFALDSLVELVSASLVLRRLRGRHSDAIAESLADSERRTSRFVGWALYALAGYIVASSAASLVFRVRPEASAAGLGLAIAAAVVMPLLWRWRLQLSQLLHSSALKADAACSAVCFYMSLVLLAGLAANGLFGWWWADPLAALAMIWWIRKEAAEALEAARTGTHCDDCATPAGPALPHRR